MVTRRGLTTDEYTLVFSPCNRRRLHVRVHWLPLWKTPSPDVTSCFENFGRITSCFEETRSHTTLKAGYGTGVRHIEMAVREVTHNDISYRTSINRRQCLITIPGRPPLCLKCVVVGHYRSECDRLSRRLPTSCSGAVRRSVKTPEAPGEKDPLKTNRGVNQRIIKW